jgi:hypothetical protein
MGTLGAKSRDLLAADYVIPSVQAYGFCRNISIVTWPIDSGRARRVVCSEKAFGAGSRRTEGTSPPTFL